MTEKPKRPPGRPPGKRWPTPVTVLLGEAVAEKLKAVAADRGVSAAAVARAAIATEVGMNVGMTCGECRRKAVERRRRREAA